MPAWGKRLLVILLLAGVTFYFYTYRPLPWRWPAGGGDGPGVLFGQKSKGEPGGTGQPSSSKNNELKTDEAGTKPQKPVTFEIKVSPNPRLGEATVVTVKWVGEYAFASGQVQLGDDTFPLFLAQPPTATSGANPETSPQLLAILPISYWHKPGPDALLIKLRDKSGGEKVLRQEITIAARDYPREELTVKEELTQLRTEEKIRDDSQKLTAAKSDPLPQPVWEGNFLLPAEGEITTGYGLVRVINGKETERHSGLDIANKKGTPIRAANSGRVTLAEDLYVTGKTVVIDHGFNIYSSYSHLASINVKAGEWVKKGQVIGTMGSTGFSTGPHLHWVISVGRTPVDPQPFLEGTIFGAGLPH